jgi:exodeoxyribonuclease VII large subunit
MPSLRDATAESPAPVRALALALTDWIGRLGTVWVEGQVTQVSRRPGLQTVFLTLRDTHADVSVPVTCPRSLVDSLDPPLVEGGSIVVLGRPDYYPTRGSLSLAVREIRMVGLGELLARLERRRRLLAAEGLFDPALKRRLPFLPVGVGLVTAPDSAAERDVVENARRRWPGVRIVTVHAAMQGTRAVPEVIHALGRLERHVEVDVVVVARGGGSVEDLLPFSDEALVRAVHAMRTPVVSAIGHEPDTPLLDLVADVRASTPTDAAKTVVPDVVEEARGVEQARGRLRRAVGHLLDREQALLTQLRSRPAMADPRSLVAARAQEVDGLRERGRRTVRHRLERAGDEVGALRLRAQALSPLATLERGYAVLQDVDGGVITSVTGTSPGAAVSARLVDGRVHATTTSVEEDPDE